MKITPIFVYNLSEGLHAIQYDCYHVNEYVRNFDLWNDYEYLLQFCKENSSDILSGYYKIENLEEFIDAIIDEANRLEDMLINFIEEAELTGHNNLQEIFKPLNNGELTLPVLQTTKAIIRNMYINKPKLRLYALRLEKNSFVLTGGAIKITRYMGDSEHTANELDKMIEVRSFLCQIELYSQDDLEYYYHG